MKLVKIRVFTKPPTVPEVEAKLPLSPGLPAHIVGCNWTRRLRS